LKTSDEEEQQNQRTGHRSQKRGFGGSLPLGFSLAVGGILLLLSPGAQGADPIHQPLAGVAKYGLHGGRFFSLRRSSMLAAISANLR
jgi:hypothetical protein